MSNWSQKAIFYHIYPLGFVGAPFEHGLNEKVEVRLEKIVEWIPHLKSLGINAVLLGPVFESTSHGYDTRDYYQVDTRLGDDETMKKVCYALHEAGIKVVLDGVFNHVGREFWAFKDLQEHKQDSIYKDWFQNVNFSCQSPYGDPFTYAAWEGHFELVQLNLYNEGVRNHLLNAVEKWINEYDIDGIRIDVAYCINEDFLRVLRKKTNELKEDFWLMGEMIHGDYNRLLKEDLLNSVTNYECYKGIYSSHNEKNYFEINYSLNRLFGKGGLYQGKFLYNFVDNHDVDRIGSILKQKEHIENVYTLLFTMPGIPSIYYGSEWQIEGCRAKNTDRGLRPCLELDQMMQLDQKMVNHISKLSEIRENHLALTEGDYEQVVVRNEQLVYARNFKDERIYIVLNLAQQPYTFEFEVHEQGNYKDLLTGEGYESTNKHMKIQLNAFKGMILML